MSHSFALNGVSFLLACLETAEEWFCDGAGTLTQNKMAVSRLWLAGQDVRDSLDRRTGSNYGSGNNNGTSSHSLDAKALSVLVEGVALNSTAELRDNGSER